MNNDVVISSRVRLARNLKQFPFPTKISEKGAEQLIKEAKTAILNNEKSNKKFEYIDLRTLSYVDKVALMENRIISPQLVKKTLPSAVILSEDKKTSVMINEEDHLRIQCISEGMDIYQVFNIADKLDDSIEEKLQYAFSEKYGYLTSCPTNVGTGMRASYMVHVPALEMYGQLQIILQAIVKFGIAVRGIYGEGTEAAGNVFQISNQITLGQSEKEIMDNLNNITNQIVEQERKVRQKLLEEKRIPFEDKIYRSYGILTNARKISAKEAMSFLSDVRLGIKLGILKIDNIGINIYDLMTNIQPACLQKQVGKDLTVEDRDVERANYLRKVIPKLC